MKIKHQLCNLIVIVILLATVVFCGYLFPTLSFYYQNKTFQTHSGKAAVEEKNFVLSSNLENTLQIFATNFSTLACPLDSLRRTKDEVYQSGCDFFEDLGTHISLPFSLSDISSREESGALAIIGDSKISDIIGVDSQTVSDVATDEVMDSTPSSSDETYTAYVWICSWELANRDEIQYFVDDRSNKVVRFQYYAASELYTGKNDTYTLMKITNKMLQELIPFFSQYYGLSCDPPTMLEADANSFFPAYYTFPLFTEDRKTMFQIYVCIHPSEINMNYFY